MTLREAHHVNASRLAREPALREHASRDAATLILHALHLAPTALHAYPGRSLAAEELVTISALIERRLRLEPIQYIVGEQEFYGLPFRVTPATLIPRPETELLVQSVLERIPQGMELHLVDVGTGSGAIAIALARHLPQAHVLALEVSAEALLVARENAEINGIAANIELLQSDLLDALPSNKLFDAIVSNPPYIAESDKHTLHPQVRDHEPTLALFAGADGLDIYRRLLPQARKALKPEGLLAVEFGFGQSPAIRHLLEAWTGVEILDDLQGIPRVALARKPG